MADSEMGLTKGVCSNRMLLSYMFTSEKTSFNTVDNISPVEKSSSIPLVFTPFMIVFSVLGSLRYRICEAVS